MRRMTSFLIIILLALAGTATAAGKTPQPASAVSTATQTIDRAQTTQPKQPSTPLESLLNADGTLNLASGYTGSLDPQSWRMMSAPGEKPRFERETTDAPNVAGDENWDRRFGTPGVSYSPYALAIMGDDVYVGGSYFTAGNLTVNGIARWNRVTGRWHTLGVGPNNGVDGYVEAITVIGSDVYVGGAFGIAGAVFANNIAKWDPAAQQWSPLGAGANGRVHAIALTGVDIYVGGDFTMAGDQTVNHIARWNTVTQQWYPLGSGVTGGHNYTRVYDIAVIGLSVFAGGNFTNAGGVSANKVARWDTTAQQWHPLGNGLNGGNGTPNGAFALETIGSDLYVGGNFSTAGEISALNIARWDALNNQWHFVSENPGSGVYGFIYDMSAIGTDLYVGGEFEFAWLTLAQNVAKWDSITGQWQALGSGSDVGVIGGEVKTIVAEGNAVYVGGWFGAAAGGVGANRIAGWNATNSQWFPLNESVAGSNGTGDDVYAVAISGSDVYVGGYFLTVGGIAANYVARWDSINNRWHSLGNGVGEGYDPIVFAIAVSGNSVYVGGYFTRAGTHPAYNIARWDITTNQWHSLGSGASNGVNGSVYALTADGSDIYVGGDFGGAGGMNAHHIAKWDATNNQWTSLGSGTSNGVNDYVIAIAIIGSDVYAGGVFTIAGATSANRIAKWDSVAQEWSALGSGVGGFSYSYVYALTSIGDDLYAGGRFLTAGGITINHIAKWNIVTQQWSALGDGVASNYEPRVTALTVIGSNLYVGGDFDASGTINTKNIAVWDTIHGEWHTLGSGVSGDVFAIASIGNNLYVGGSFSKAGNRVSNNFAIYHLPCPMTFTDVQLTDYFYNAVQYLYCSGAVSGYEGHTFRPYNNTTRAQLTKIVTLAEGWPLENPTQPHFSDVPRNHPFYRYVETAYAQRVISGYADSTFRPLNDVTRAQLCKIVALAEEWELECPAPGHFSDVSTTSPFYCYIETAYSRGIISGYADGTFRPGNNATRGQISKIVYTAVTQP